VEIGAPKDELLPADPGLSDRLFPPNPPAATVTDIAVGPEIGVVPVIKPPAPPPPP
jgi:hypothetical protein